MMYLATVTSKTYSIISHMEAFIKSSGLPLMVIGRFSDGSTTLDFIKKNNVDIVIAEINLPDDIGGLKLVQSVGALNSGMAFIMLSNPEEFCYEYARQAMESGVTSYLIHPVSEGDLHNALHIALKKIEIFAPFLRPSPVLKPIQEESPDQSQSRAIAEKISDFIAQKYAEPLTICDIINHFYISESYINRLLMKYKQKSFKKILTEIRINRAKELMLSYPAMSIAEVAHTVGYNDSHYFSRMYKAYTGISPSFDRDIGEI